MKALLLVILLFAMSFSGGMSVAQTKCQHTADVLGGQSQTLREMETELMFLYIILGAMIVLTLSVSVWAFYMLRERRIVVAKNRELLRMKNDGESIPLVVEKRRDPQQEELFVTIDTAIRQERLYADVALQRQDVCDRFGINRHALNELLVQYAEGLSFPQYVNDIRLQEALRLLHNENEWRGRKDHQRDCQFCGFYSRQPARTIQARLRNDACGVSANPLNTAVCFF